MGERRSRSGGQANFRQGGKLSERLTVSQWLKTVSLPAAGSRRSPVLRRSVSHHGSMKIVRIGALDFHSGEFAGPQRPARRHVDGAVDLRGIAPGAAAGAARTGRIDEDLLAGADAAL